MSNESRDRKTEKPTARRLRKARQDGNAPSSREASATAALLGVTLYLWFGREHLGARLEQLGRYGLESATRFKPDSTGFDIVLVLIDIALLILWIIVPIAITAVAATIVVNFAQVGGLFAPRAIAPRGERINPAEGTRRLFALRNLIELGKALAKIIALIVTLFLVIRWSIPTMVKMPQLTMNSVVTVATLIFIVFFAVGIGIFFAITLFDIWFQQHNFIRENRMSREELKRERRDDEGDPQLRAERRKQARELAGDSLKDRTARASIVFHSGAQRLAVAIFVDQDPDTLPWLLNKGQDHIAESILSVARHNQIRIVQDSMLTRKIDTETAIDADVPRSLSEQIRSFFV